MSSPHDWKLQPCAGSLKVWQDASDLYKVLFEHPRVMAKLFGLGVPCYLLTVRREGKFLRLCATQLNYVKWLELWQKESSGGQIPISKFIGQCGNLASSSNPSTSSSSASLPSSSAATFHPGQSSSGGASSSSQSAGTDISDGLTFLSLDDGAGVRRLHISVLVGNKPGDGIAAANSSLVLAAKPDHRCELASSLDFIFSEHHPPPSLPQPIRRKIEVTIVSRYGIPGTCLIEPVPVPPIILGGGANQPATHERGGGAIQPATHGPSGLQHIGIVHDNMYVNFECKENFLGSTLIANEALDVVTMDLSHKEEKARQRGWEGSVTVGSTSIAKGDVKHTRASSSLKEVTTLMRPNVIAGTQFHLWDTCRKSAITHVLSYKATHIPPIERVSKLEDAGLDTTPREFVTSDLAMPVNLKCKGEFLLIGSGLKKHTFEMGRSLGEFQVKVDEGPAKKFMRRFQHSHLALLQAKQKLEIEFIVNHDFDLRMYEDVHLYWLLVGAAERTLHPMCWIHVKGATNHFI